MYINERRLLTEAGHEVVDYVRRNDDLAAAGGPGKLRAAYTANWSKSTHADITALLRRFRPDIAHFHNTFPLISPSGWAACRDQGVPVVQTLHNYRLICPGALLQRDGSPCEDCVGKNPWPAIRYRCYRGSFLASAAVARMLMKNRSRGSYTNLVDRYIALTKFAASRMIAGGFDQHRIVLKPNFLPAPPDIGLGNGGYAIFVGRLSAEKGLLTLLQAWQDLNDLPLKIVGDGPLRSELTAKAKARALPVEFLGYRSRTEILELVRGAVLQLVPSEWYEGFPMVILEAYACGTPVVASTIGSLDEIVIEGMTGRKFPPGSPAQLAMTVRETIASLMSSGITRPRVRRHFDDNYTETRNLELLLKIYNQLSGNN